MQPICWILAHVGIVTVKIAGAAHKVLAAEAGHPHLANLRRVKQNTRCTPSEHWPNLGDSYHLARTSADPPGALYVVRLCLDELLKHAE